MTTREQLLNIILTWFKTARPDNSDAPSELADRVMEWLKEQLIDMDTSRDE
jgi:hypothetical protein